MATVITDPPAEQTAPVQTTVEPQPEAPQEPSVLPPPPPPEQPAEPRRLLRQYEGFFIPALILFALGNAFAYALPGLPLAQPHIAFPMLVMLAGLVFAAAGRQDSRWAIRLNLWLVFLIAGCLHYHYRQFSPPPDDLSRMAPLDRAEVMGTVEVLSARNRAVIQVREINGQKVTGRAQMSLPRDTMDLAAGTRVLVTADVRTPFGSEIPGAFDQAKFLATQHISVILRKPGRLIAFEQSNEPQYLLQRTTDTMKEQVAATFAKSLPSPHAEVLGGIVLGERAIPLDRDTRQAFIQTGLVHILAASGLNVGIIGGAVLGLMLMLRTPFRMRILVAMLAVALYSMLTGLPPSIQRAAAMLELALFLKLLNRELSPVFLLCVAVTMLLALNPENIGNIGFQFSVLTTFGLITMVPPLQDKLGYYITRWLAGLILVPVVAQLWVWPLSVHYFNQFPIHSVPLNLLAVALVAPLTVIGFTTGMISLILPVLAEWLTWLARPFLEGLLWLVHWGNAMDWAHWRLASPPGWMVLLLYGQWLVLLGLLYRLKDWPPTRKAAVALVPLALMLAGLSLGKAQAGHATTLDVLPLSYKHQAYLVQPAGTDTRVLVMPENLAYFEGRALSDYLRHRNIAHLPAVILLPQAEAGDEEPPTDGLKAAFRQARVETVYTPHPAAPPRQLLSLPATFRTLPAGGAVLRAAGLRVESTGETLRLLQDGRCLLSMSPAYDPQAERCAAQAVRDARGTRLYSDTMDLETDRFHGLVLHGSTVRVYEGRTP